MQVFIISMLVCTIMILLLRKVAHRLDLMDCPGGRKQHQCPTPAVGGLAMLFGVLAALLADGSLHGNVAILLGCSAMLVVLGVLDDKHSLSVPVRMMAQVFLVTVVIVDTGGTITHLGALIGKDISLGMFAVPFSVVAFVGGINSINMIDGMDGMAGKMALITMLGVAVISYVAGNVDLLPLTWAMLGTLAGFLLLNSRVFVRRAWVFMGDSGSMWLGLVLVWFIVQLTQGNAPAEPAMVLWLFGIPLMDSVAVMFRRVRHKRSPFQADRTHIHYLLKHMGLSTRRNVLVLSLAQLVLVSVGVIFYLANVPAWIVFWCFMLLWAFYTYLFHRTRGRDRRNNTARLNTGRDDRRQNNRNIRAGDRKKFQRSSNYP